MTIEIGLLFGAIACIIGVAGFIGGQKTGAKGDGERWGELKADIRHMKDDIAEIKVSLEKSATKTDASIRRLHKRLDDHLRNEHKITVPEYAED